jgi:hypothetical protein
MFDRKVYDKTDSHVPQLAFRSTSWSFDHCCEYFNSYRRADNFRPMSHCQRMRVSLCYELNLSAERNKRERDKQTASGRSIQCTNNRDPITSTSELLMRQNSNTAHAHQSQARRLASDHCATEIHWPKSAVRPIYELPCS